MTLARVALRVQYEFECTCGWRGTQPTFDAHLNPWCPTCWRPAEFSEIAKLRRSR